MMDGETIDMNPSADGFVHRPPGMEAERECVFLAV